MINAYVLFYVCSGDFKKHVKIISARTELFSSTCPQMTLLLLIIVNDTLFSLTCFVLKSRNHFEFISLFHMVHLINQKIQEHVPSKYTLNLIIYLYCHLYNLSYFYFSTRIEQRLLIIGLPASYIAFLCSVFYMEAMVIF